VVVETIFDWPGIGFYTVQAILTADTKVMLAVTLLIGGHLRHRQHPGRRPARPDRSAPARARLRRHADLAKFAKDKPAVLAAPLVVIVVAICGVSPAIGALSRRRGGLPSAQAPETPSWDHPFGTDNLGRDILSRVILGRAGP
jgi:hypothetical protein